MILLDTNVISELMRPAPAKQVIAWVDRQPRFSVWTTAISTYELRAGLQLMSAGAKREMLSERLERLLSETIEHRIVAFDTSAAAYTADLDAARHRAGSRGELRDTMIAGITLASRATLATRNVRHFADIASHVIDPWSL